MSSQVFTDYYQELFKKPFPVLLGIRYIFDLLNVI